MRPVVGEPMMRRRNLLRSNREILTEVRNYRRSTPPVISLSSPPEENNRAQPIRNIEVLDGMTWTRRMVR
jgi:hypothetical protein